MCTCGHVYVYVWVCVCVSRYTAVADAWMKQVTEDFGSDHVWQMDGFFANGSSWGAEHDQPSPSSPPPVPCEWSAAINNTYLAGYVHGKALGYPTLPEAKAACLLPASSYLVAYQCARWPLRSRAFG